MMTDHSENTDHSQKDTSGHPAFFARHKLPVILGVLVLVLSATGLSVWSSARANLDADQAALARALTVNVITLTAEQHYLVKQKYSGTITAARESDHGFDRGGLLAEVLVDDGDQVKKGDILARLDMRRLDAREQELIADYKQASALQQESAARLDRAQATFDRYRVLLEKKHISAEKFDQVKFDLIALKAREVATKAAVAKSGAALKSLSIDRDMAHLTARFEGSVVRRYLDEGTALGAGTPVIRLIEDRKLEIQVGMPAAAASALIPGEAHIFIYQGRKVTTRLRAILKRMDRATRTVTAIFDVTDRNNNLGDNNLKNNNIRAGDLAQLSIDRDIQQDGFWLPTRALAESQRGLWSVYSLKPHKKSPGYATLSRQELQVLYTESERVFVRGTLQDGDRIVTGGLHRLVPGQLVRMVEAQ